jgi:hypothetical protein
MLLEILTELEGRTRELAQQRNRLQLRASEKPHLPPTSADLRKQFEEAARGLTVDSFEFGSLMRSLVSECHIYVVRCVDGVGGFLPRARVKLSLGGIIQSIHRAPELETFLTRELTIDLFKPLARVEIREEAVKQSVGRVKQRDIATNLNSYQVTVQQALNLEHIMRDRGLTNPFELVVAPPAETESRKIKRSRHERYRFEVREGYEPPPL